MDAMNKRHLSRIMSACRRAFLRDVSGSIAKQSRVRVERAAKTSLVMMKARDSVSNRPFYLGEVLITECTVSVNGKFGIGMVVGEQPERAYLMAVIDAAVNAGLPVVETWQGRWAEEAARIDRAREAECHRAAQSKVNFDTMGEYNDRR